MARLGDYITEYSVRNKKDDPIPVYSVTNEQGFCTGYFDKDVASKDRTTYKIVPYGYFAYNPSRINVGSVDYQHVTDKVIVSPLYVVFQTSPDLEQRYLYYYLKSEVANVHIRSNASGSVRDNLKFVALSEFDIPLPDLPTQRRIAATLDKVSEGIAVCRQMLADLETLIKARFVEMFGDVIHNDRNWKKHLFSEITTSRLGKMLDAKQQTGEYPFPYLGNANVQWFRFDTSNLNQMDFNEADQVEFALEDGDLLVCEGGEIGRCAVWHNQVQPCFFQKAIHRVRCNKQFVLPDYLAWWFKFNCEHNGFSAIEGAKATIAHLPGAKLKQLQVVVPPIELQNRFVDLVAQLDKSKFVVQQQLAELETLKKSLMQEYFA